MEMEDMIENLFVKSNGLVGVLLKCVQKRDNLMLHTFFFTLSLSFKFSGTYSKLLHKYFVHSSQMDTLT